VIWHDGRPFTSADVAFTVQAFLPEVHPRARANFARVDGVTTPDARTVVFRLKEPFAPFLTCFDVTSCPIVPRHIYEGTDFRNNPAHATPIGTGPFKLREWVRGSHIALVRNDSYFNPGQPYLDGIIFRFIPDAAARALALERSEAHQSQFDAIEPFEVRRLAALPNLTMTTRGYEFLSPIMWLDINVRRPPLDDKRVRQALMLAMDREFIHRALFFGLGKVATGPIASTTRFYDPDVQHYPFDVARANALLDAAGLRRGPGGVRARLKALVLPYGEVWQRLGEYTRQAFRAIGIEITLENVDVSTFFQRTTNWDYELSWLWLSQFGDPALGVSRVYVSSNIRRGVPGSNIMGYSNPRVDALFDEGARAVRDEDRQRAYSTVQRILVDEVPVAWILEMTWPNFLNRRVHGAITTALGPVESYDGVWMEP
jgi:peptide/nickel transport system substrate-binding protein